MPDSPYDSLAEIYDSLQTDAEPSAWSDRVADLIKRFGPAKGDGQDGKLLVCDLGCGSGSMCLELAERGFDVIGIDSSENMLQISSDKFIQRGLEGLFLLQDISKIELFGTVDVFLCMTDTVNHLVRKTDFMRMTRSFSNYLNPNGLFIFDVLTQHHLKNTLGNKVFYAVDDDYALLWQNRYAERSGLSTSDMTLFKKDDSGKYDRHDCTVKERYYSEKDISEAIDAAGMNILSISGDLRDTASRKTDVRRLYVTRRK
jgi:SAM-dependent methyltransferase